MFIIIITTIIISIIIRIGQLALFPVLKSELNRQTQTSEMKAAVFFKNSLGKLAANAKKVDVFLDQTKLSNCPYYYGTHNSGSRSNRIIHGRFRGKAFVERIRKDREASNKFPLESIIVSLASKDFPTSQ